MLIPTTTCLPQSDSKQPNEWAKQTGYWKIVAHVWFNNFVDVCENDFLYLKS